LKDVENYGLNEKKVKRESINPTDVNNLNENDKNIE
jgi:hypothetical protein